MALLAYCLMPNHYHLLLETTRAEPLDGMQYLNGDVRGSLQRGARARTGHVFQGASTPS